MAETAVSARVERDAILDEVRTAGTLPQWCWDRIAERVASFDRLPVDMQSFGLRYARDVAERGIEFFASSATDGQLIDSPVIGGMPLACSVDCGGTSGPTADDRDGPKGRRYRYGTCRKCGTMLVEWR